MNNLTAFFQSQVIQHFELTLRLFVALILGGIIGFERESTHRPAGFRTHILVCVGAALVMITSEFVFAKYRGQANLDPARLGAQVISGVGFLGAGTILREGVSVKGLTTAASLWAVSCVGIAAGIGFYEGAIAATIIIYITLISLKKMQRNIKNKKMVKMFYVDAEYVPGRIGQFKDALMRNDMIVKDVDFVDDEEENSTIARFLIQIPSNIEKEDFVEKMLQIEGIRKVYEC